ncbi:probable G-protein coupled receptor No18 isoform X2 [Artemia franciscana]|uniref:probable G-protein coupled receptor No18 isoform X2 n=1 Tax=Artemia franciscana TaxID=6661 RepID=UPI0032DBD170
MVYQDPTSMEEEVASTLLSIAVDVVLSLIFLLGTVSNSILLVVFYRRPSLRSLSNRFVMSLLIMNLVATCIFLPLVFLDNVAKHPEESEDFSASIAMCSVGQFFASFVSTGSMVAALLIGLDQYFAVMDPLHYHSKITKARAYAMLVGKWVVSAVLAGFAVPDLTGKEMWKGCADIYDNIDIVSFQDVTFSSLTVVFLGVSVLLFIVPLLVLVWVYMRIYNAAHKNSQRTRRNSLSFSTNELVKLGTATPLMGNGQGPLSRANSTILTQQDVSAASVSSAKLSRSPSLRSTSSQLVHNLRYRISNASLFLYREEARAVRISVSVIVTLLLCLLPYHVSLVLNLLPNIQVPQYVNSCSFIAILCNSLLSPFLYAYRSRRLQKELRRLFGLSPHSSSSKKRRHRTVRRMVPVALSDPADEKKKDVNANRPIEMKEITNDIVITVTEDSRGSFSSGTTFPSSSMGDSDVSL